jgi:hypothetical protein
VRIVRDPERDGSALAVDLADADGARLHDFTARHVGDHVAIVVAGEERMRPLIRDPIAGPTLLLTGRDDAEVETMRRALAP